MKQRRFSAFILALSLVLLWGCGQVQTPPTHPTTEAATLPAPTAPPSTAPTAPPTQPETEPTQPPPPQILEQWEPWLARNPLFVGWISIPGTIIDYPVVYCNDNAYYLKHDIDNNDHEDGTIFLSMEADLLERNRSMALFGHHRNNGLMFSDLHKYKKLDFVTDNPIIAFDSLYEEADYVIFSVFYMAGNASDGNYYYFPKADFDDDQAFLLHVQQLKVRSIFDIPVEANADDQVIILTCCTYETDNLRISVAARKLREGESVDSIDMSQAAKAQNPLYPAKWYDKFGGKAPQIQWITLED